MQHPHPRVFAICAICASTPIHTCHPLTVPLRIPQPKAIRSHALIGQNGTGKSNLIEALITIFAMDLIVKYRFDFIAEYSIRAAIAH